MTRLLKFSKYNEDRSTADSESAVQDGALTNKTGLKQSGARQSVARSNQDPSVRWSRLMPTKRRKAARQPVAQHAEVSSLPGVMDDLHQKLEQRVEYLEQVNRIYQDALELARSFGDFQESISNLHKPENILSESIERAGKLIEFDAQSIFQVQEEQSDLSLQICDSEEMKDQVLKEFEILVNNGTIDLAVKEGHPVMVASSGNEFQVLIQGLVSGSNVRGVFIGLIRTEEADIPEVLFPLLSIVLSGCANALEACELYSKINAKKEKLEEALRRKTAELTALQDEMDIRVNKKLEQMQKELDSTREEITAMDNALLWFKDHSLLTR